mmetsp:Transcript_20075/g.18228  ORF Transcript_20075/g.18228 Transcript_20075/m.18228 type:complete len:315 (+) Transcript_20075:69-1013(+)
MDHQNKTNNQRQRKRLFYTNYTNDLSTINTNLSKRLNNNEKFERSGKWTPEEESFANRLISDFEAGRLKDCDDGCTLRSYLARRLRCAPMRISKKFTGRCIGKLVFARQHVHDNDNVHLNTIEELEHLYHKSYENNYSTAWEDRNYNSRDSDDASSLTDSLGHTSSIQSSGTDSSHSTNNTMKIYKNRPKSKSKPGLKAAVIKPVNKKQKTIISNSPFDIYDSSPSSCDNDLHYGMDLFDMESFHFDSGTNQQNTHEQAEAQEWLNVLSFFCDTSDLNSIDTSLNDDLLEDMCNLDDNHNGIKRNSSNLSLIVV